MNQKILTRFINQATCGTIIALVLGGTSARAQTETKPPKPPAETVTQTFYLTNVSEEHEVNEVLTALRNTLSPYSKVYLVPSQNAIVLTALADQVQLAQKVLHDLDRPRRTYRLTYTLTESDAGKRIGVQHYALIVVSGQKTTMKQGSRVPVVTGSYSTGSSERQSQFNYFDVGLNFEATLDESVIGVRLRTKAEETGIVEGTSGAGPNNPVVRQTLLEGTSILTPGKPLVLGSFDVPGSTRHQDVEVVMEVVK